MKTMFLFLVLVAGTINIPVQAGKDISQSEIRKLVNRGELLSLETIISMYPEKKYGKLLDLEAERDHGTVIYEMEFLRKDGAIIELKVNARNGSLLELEVED